MDKLAKYRNELDGIDESILQLLGKRIVIVKKIGKYKKENNLPVVDRTREKKLLIGLEEKARKYNLDFEMVKKIWKTIFTTAYKIEK